MRDARLMRPAAWAAHCHRQPQPLETIEGAQLMNISSTTARILLAAGVAAGALAAVSATQSSAEAAASPGAVFRRAATNVDLPTTGGPANTVVSIPLPAGDWVVQAKANGVYFGRPEDYIRCGIFFNFRPIPASVGSTIHLGTHLGGGGTYVGPLANVAVVHTSTSGFVQLMCSHDRTVLAGMPVPYVEDAALLATRPGVIDG
ncbi:hypothetical protein ACQP2Y_13540 [Actinoplanes sp. CA-051413]|uniref:hypothetical protein n=1 Tax=Actinoplanes sp. CA-051413 TaxID=3239899 RepID=UPI003D98D83D